MKKFLVIGKPIDHSLSPNLHNYWFKENNIDAIYNKKNVEISELRQITDKLRIDEIAGINVTVPYKREIINYIDILSPEAKDTSSVNTIYKEKNKIIGHNTDIAGFELAIRQTKFDIANKKILIIGAGGVVPSIIYSLKRMKVSEIAIMNRTKNKATKLKTIFKNLKLIDWGKNFDFDMFINATSVGLGKDDSLNLDFKNIEPGKFFYDLIYNPPETNFLKEAKKNLHRTENGKLMFIYQAHQAFTIWHKIMPEINEDIYNIL
ncbi:MAG: shikimate dehydrogenase [Candidatus Pelagibacter sp. TMED118]|nr:MAG: shikimate dehydrogenase [Candidatus Pelagibacter sp. TMED118]|tara:strand:- start:11363 stop:12151 length:789 start_codon:yes stop_codon:yes gene_type:complete